MAGTPNILEKLKCVQCEDYLSCGPVHITQTGDGVCGRCSVPTDTALRNKHYETVAETLKFPCKYKQHGCRVESNFTLIEEPGLLHEDTCEFKPYGCLVAPYDTCDWIGPRTKIVTHCQTFHPQKLLENPCVLEHDITITNEQVFIISAFEALFLLRIKVCLSTRKFYHSVRLLDEPLLAFRFRYSLTITNNGSKLIKENKVSPQGDLCLDPTTCLVTNINTVLEFLGSFDCVKFHLQLEDTIPPCVNGCGNTVRKLSYRSEDGWLCEYCTPSKEPCEPLSTLPTLNPCKFAEVPQKRKKHKTFFCQNCTKCMICRAQLKNTTPQTHYLDHHSDITHKSGSVWRVSFDDSTTLPCIITNSQGSTLCQYTLTDSYINFDLYTPNSSEELYKYCCTIQIADPSNGHTVSRTKDVTYHLMFDWRIEVDISGFPTDNPKEFDFCIDIHKKKH